MGKECVARFVIGPIDGRLAATERVVAIEVDGAAKAYPFSVLVKQAPAAIHDQIAGTDVVIFFKTGTASALDGADIAGGRDVGASGVFLPTIDGRTLTFAAGGDGFVDQETASRWTLLGQAVEGPLAGSSLEPVAHIDTFWFAWGAFQPDTVIWEP